MTEAEEKRRALENTLFLALNRPAMIFGVPREGLLFNASGSVIAGAWAGVGTWHILLWIPTLFGTIHVIMRAGIAQDYNYFRIKILAYQTKLRALNPVFWGGYMLRPLPINWPWPPSGPMRLLAHVWPISLWAKRRMRIRLAEFDIDFTGMMDV